MGMRYPQERRGNERGPDDQQYEDARENMAESEAEIRDTANPELDVEEELSEEDRTALLERNAEDRFAEIGDQRQKDERTDADG